MSTAKYTIIPQLTTSMKDHLSTTAIDASGPGSILSDFHMFLDFVAESSPPLTAKFRLSSKTLASLNKNMSVPLQHRLNRPVQKSYPHLEGLYLLIRATGLAYIDDSDKKPALTIDEGMLDSWTQLNETERYFTLLETWLVRASPEIVESRTGSLFISSHARWYRLFQDIPTDGLRASDGKNLLEELRYWPGAYNLALMELFGLVEVSIGQLIEGEGWQISQIRRTEYGDAILAAVTTSSDEVDPFIFADNFIPPPLGSWQPRLQPYFPQWKKNLENKEEGYRAGLHIFTVALDSEVWRRLAVPAECSLEDLATAIRNAYGFDNDHLYQFIVETVSGHRHYVFHPYMDDEPATTDVKVGEIPLREGKSMLFNYDFGDNWNFDVRLECVDENDTHSATTSVLEKRGESPEQYLDYDGHWE